MDNISRDKKETETSVLKFLSSPRIWIVLAIIILIGYWLVMLMKNIKTVENEVNNEFRTMCEQDLGDLAWMKMKPMRDGKEISDKACFGCMADDNNMICDKGEYERYKTEHGL